MDRLVEYIRRHSSRLEPLPTGESPKLDTFPGIKAVVFDIYGTVLISAAGDISHAGGENAPAKAMGKALQLAGISADPEKALSRYVELIAQSQKETDVEYPEVEIREIWAQLLRENDADPELAEQVCIAYECVANPVWPMPGFQECLVAIRDSGRTLGIISNAQFYTPLLFPALLNKSLAELGFDPAVSVFSYQIREGKPSPSLFEKVKSALELQPEQILYIGNDRLKDIWPAQLEGMRTVLFAGDARSLRWRDDDARLSGVQPDAVVTHLNQIPELLA